MPVKITTIMILFISIVFPMNNSLWAAEDTVISKEPSPHRKIYFFEHRLLPELIPTKTFCNSLMNGTPDSIIRIAATVVGEEFSRNISIRKYSEHQGILLTFPKPVEPNECFFIYIVRTEEGCRYITYEKTREFPGSDAVGVVGEWRGEIHINSGPRKYDDAESFVKELQQPK
jgi:hypothetical protein